MVKGKLCYTSKDREIGEIHAGVTYIKESLDKLNGEVKENTKFRIQAKGVIGAVSFISAILGGFFLWIIKKVWG
jgi:hypothetical protein